MPFRSTILLCGGEGIELDCPDLMLDDVDVLSNMNPFLEFDAVECKIETKC